MLQLLDPETLRISPSQLSTMRTCMVMWHFKYVARREANRPAIARDAGKAFHAALEPLHRGAGLAAAEAALAKHWPAATEGDDYRTETRYREVLRLYDAHYQEVPMKTLALELPFAVELGEVEVPASFFERLGLPVRPRLKVVLEGFMDYVAAWEGKVRIVDTKTMSEYGLSVGDKYARDPQLKLYCWAWNRLAATTMPELLEHGPCNSAVLDAVIIRKPAVTGKSSKPREEFKRIPLFWEDWDLQETAENALEWVRAAAQQFATGTYLANDGACGGQWGRKCDYFGVCAMPPGIRESVLASDEYRDKGAGRAAEMGEQATL